MRTPRPAAARPPRRAPRLAIAVQYALSRKGLPGAPSLRAWAGAALERDCEVTVRLVGLAEGRRLNRDYRGRDSATNVLTFVYRSRAPCSGDIVLCAPLIAREAAAQGKSLQSHYAHLVVHGMLHLQGYDHQSDRDARIMQRRETRIVMPMGYPDPYRPASRHGP